MKFAHLSDCHIGGWREDELKELSIQAFERALEMAKEENVEFILIAGDLFNTALPSIEALKRTTSALKKIKDVGIKVYLIPGSHDFSPSRKTMLDVLENAGLCIDVFKHKENKLLFTKHTTKENEEIKLTGMVGLAGGLEKTKYQELENKEELEQETGCKIFLFHTLLTELRPKRADWEKVPAEPLSLLPKNFNYYAGGHPHFVLQKSFPNHSLVTYPGPLFPNNFKEIEELKHGGFFIIEKKEDKMEAKHVPVPLKETKAKVFDANGKTPEEVQQEIMTTLEKENITDAIVTLRVAGTLKSGKTSEVNFKEIIGNNKQAYIILKNTTKLKTKEFEEVTTITGDKNDIEESIIKEHLDTIELPGIENEEQLITQLMISCDKEKDEGERILDFEARLIKDLIKICQIEKAFQ